MPGPEEEIIIGTGHQRQAEDTTSPTVGEMQAMKARLIEVKDFVIANGDDTVSRQAANDGKHKVDDLIDRALELNAAL